MTDSPEYVLELTNISKRFLGVQALDEVNLSVRPGTVHALIGENGAGKSTLIKIVAGIYEPDGGTITFQGKERKNLTPFEAIGMGISTIHQELSYISEMTIVDNVFLGREIVNTFGLLDYSKMKFETTKVLKEVGLTHNPSLRMRDLSIGGMQMVEIAKSIFKKASLIIMDEPTSSLTSAEVDVLFAQIRKLKEQSIAVIYISHKLDEIVRIADEVTILRDGKQVESDLISAYSMERMITKMVGRSITNVYPTGKAPIGKPILEVKNLTSSSGRFTDINFRINSGEVLGFAGLVGAGSTEVMRAVFGLDCSYTGEVLLGGVRTKIRSPHDAIEYGIVMVSEDRKGEGLVLCRPVSENISLPNLDQFLNWLLLKTKAEMAAAKKMIEQLNIKTPSLSTLTMNLSGGNQQKVVLAKWLFREITLIILDEPTRGIDVGAKYEIYQIIRKLSEAGVGVVLVSSEMPELIGVCDRIAVMSNGKLAGEMRADEFNQEKILELAISNL